MALLSPVGEDSLLFQACLIVGVLVLVLEIVLPAIFGRRVRIGRLLRAPVLPAREFQRRKRALQQEARAIQHDVAAARSLKRQHWRSRWRSGRDASSGASNQEAATSWRKRTTQRAESREAARMRDPTEEPQAVASDPACKRPQSSMKKRRKADEAPTQTRKVSHNTAEASGDTPVDTEACARGFVPPKPMVLVTSIGTPPKAQLRGSVSQTREPLPGPETRSEGKSASRDGNSSEHKQRLVYWEDPADLFRRDTLSATVRSAATFLVVDNPSSQASSKPSARNEPRHPLMYRSREERKQEEDEEDGFAPLPAAQVTRSISARLGVSADMDASDSLELSIASLIGARQRLNPRRRPLPASSLPEPRQSRLVPQSVLGASAEPRSIVANTLIPGNTRTLPASRWSSRTSQGVAEEKKEEGDSVEEANGGGDDMAMVDSNATHQSNGAALLADKRRQAEKRTHEQAFVSAPRPRPPPPAVLPDK